MEHFMLTTTKYVKIAHLSNKTVYESTNTAILSNRRTFPDKEKLQIAQIFVDSSIRHIGQRCDINAIPFS